MRKTTCIHACLLLVSLFTLVLATEDLLSSPSGVKVGHSVVDFSDETVMTFKDGFICSPLYRHNVVFIDSRAIKEQFGHDGSPPTDEDAERIFNEILESSGQSLIKGKLECTFTSPSSIAPPGNAPIYCVEHLGSESRTFAFDGLLGLTHVSILVASDFEENTSHSQASGLLSIATKWVSLKTEPTRVAAASLLVLLSVILLYRGLRNGMPENKV